LTVQVCIQAIHKHCVGCLCQRVWIYLVHVDGLELKFVSCIPWIYP